MSDHRKLLKTAMKKRRFRLNATQTIAVGFAVIILIGAGLLALPAASRTGVSCGFLPALFTATSATCVTGLVLFDTYTQWSVFGQVVIITLIEIGGLGFMSAASTFVFLLRRKVGLRQKMVIAQAFNLNDMDGLVKIQKRPIALRKGGLLGHSLHAPNHHNNAHIINASVGKCNHYLANSPTKHYNI